MSSYFTRATSGRGVVLLRLKRELDRQTTPAIPVPNSDGISCDWAQSFAASTQIADQIEQFVRGDEPDGLMITASSDPGSFQDFVKLVVPAMQRRGLFRTEYEGSTLSEHLNLDTASMTPPPRRSAV